MTEKKVAMTVQYFNMTAECSSIRDKHPDTPTSDKRQPKQSVCLVLK